MFPALDHAALGVFGLSQEELMVRAVTLQEQLALSQAALREVSAGLHLQVHRLMSSKDHYRPNTDTQVGQVPNGVSRRSSYSF